MPLKGREETLNVEGGGLTFGKESQTSRERIEFDHCFRLYANETKSLSHLSAYSVILKHFTFFNLGLKDKISVLTTFLLLLVLPEKFLQT